MQRISAANNKSWHIFGYISIFRGNSQSVILFYFSFWQVLGATWYLLSVDRYTSCWKSFCRKKEYNPLECNLTFFDCDTFNSNARKTWANSTLVFGKCGTDGGDFKYGIFENAMSKNVVSSNFIEKYFYCLWWGLQNLRYDFLFLYYQLLGAVYLNATAKKRYFPWEVEPIDIFFEIVSLGYNLLLSWSFSDLSLKYK